MSQEPLRVAIAGCHRQTHRKPGSHNFSTAFDAVPETTIASVFDFSAETRQEFIDCWGEVPSYDNYEKMLDEIQPDIVCIATRQTMHADQVELAVERGARGILIDKPFATTLEKADRIHEACLDLAVPLAFGLDRRWLGSYQAIREHLEQGAIGDVVGASAYALPNLINHGCHWYDTLMLLLGDPAPQWVSGSVNDVSDEPEDSLRRLDPSGRAQIGFEGDVVASITSAGESGMSFEILGNQGRMMILNDGTDVHIWKLNGEEGERARPISLPDPEEGWPAGLAMVRGLIKAITNGGRTSCDIEQARRATEIGFAIHESDAAEGAKVDLPLKNRTRRIDSFPWGNE